MKTQAKKELAIECKFCSYSKECGINPDIPLIPCDGFVFNEAIPWQLNIF